MPQIEDKDAIRAQIRKARDTHVAQLPAAILNMAFSSLPSPIKPLFKAGKIIAGYQSIHSEVDVSRILQKAADNGCETALPHVTSMAAPMRFLKWQSGEPLVKGAFDLMQPQAEAPECSPDIILVPLVAFDRQCNRLGQGAGHYDRALSLLENSIKIGIAWSVQEVNNIPTDPWDIPLDGVLTEKEWITA